MTDKQIQNALVKKIIKYHSLVQTLLYIRKIEALRQQSKLEG